MDCPKTFFLGNLSRGQGPLLGGQLATKTHLAQEQIGKP